MGTQYSQITIEERCEMARLRTAGHSIRQVAASLDRSPSTVSRELKRPRFTYPGLPSGLCGSAGARSPVARVPVGAGWRSSETAFSLRLQQGWSPELVGRLALRVGQEGHLTRDHVSFHLRPARYSWRHYLPRAKSKRGWRGRKGGSRGVLYPSAPTRCGTSKGGL